MQILKALRKVIDKYKIKKIDIITLPKKGEKPSIFQKMYEALGHEKYQDDEALKKVLYGDDANDRTYKKQKTDFINRMINTILFIDSKQDKFKTRGQTDITIHRYLAAVNILKIIGLTIVSVPLAQKIVEMGIAHDLPLPTIDAADYLAHYYSLRQPDEKKFQYYNRIADEQFKKLRRISFISNIYHHIQLVKVLEPSALPKIRKRIQFHIHIIKKIAAMSASPDTIMQMAYIKLQIYPQQKHAQKRINICRKALEKLNKKPYPRTENTLLLFLYIALTQCSEVRFKAAEKSLQQAIDLSKNLHDAFQYELLATRCLIYLRSEQYDKLPELLNSLPSQITMSIQSEAVQNGWLLNRAYIYLLISTGKASVKKKISAAAIKRFFENPPDFVNGQIAQYTSMIIAQFIYMLSMRKRSEAQKLAQAMRHYLNRTKKQPHLQRTRIFLEMLCTIPAAGFKPLAVENRTQKWLDKLQQHPLELAADQPFEIELILFEKLWEIALDSLKRKNKGSEQSIFIAPIRDAQAR